MASRLGARHTTGIPTSDRKARRERALRRRLLVLTAALSLARPALAYNPPDGPTNWNATTNTPMAHGRILGAAVRILRNDGFVDAAEFYAAHLQELLDGLRAADKDGGEIDLDTHTFLGSNPIAGSLGGAVLDAFIGLKKEIPANTMSHFHDPETGDGLRLFNHAGIFSAIKDTLEYLGIGQWQTYTLLGPMPSARDMANWYYARAVEEMRHDRVSSAMVELGKSAHLVADATVPQHATDKHGGYPNGEHAEFETAADCIVAQGDKKCGSTDGFPHATTAKDFYAMGVHSPGWIVQKATEKSAARIGEVSGPPIPGVAYSTAHEIVAADMMPLAEQLTAVLLKRFYEWWSSEDFQVVMLRIDRARAKDNLDNLSDADFYAHVRIGKRWYDTGTIVNEDDVDPQVLTPFNWFFTQWFVPAPDAVPIRIELWDEDGGLNGGDDRVDITPVDGYALDIVYRPLEDRITGDVSKPGPKYHVSDSGDDAGEIWFTIERYPTVGKGAQATCSVHGTVRGSLGKPAAGSHMFFRRAGSPKAPWQRVDVSDQGDFSLVLKTGSYEFRPAGSGYDFKDVPRTIALILGTNELSFKAEAPSTVEEPGPEKLLEHQKPKMPKMRIGQPTVGGAGEHLVAKAPDKPAAHGEPEHLVAKAPEKAAQHKDPGLVRGAIDFAQAQAAKLLEHDALKVQLPSSDFGVKANGLDYEEWGVVQVHLASVLAAGTKAPLLDLGAVKVQSVLFIVGGEVKGHELVPDGAVFGPGVQGAKVKATLWLGTPQRGFRKERETFAETNAEGNATFTLRAGTHVEDARVSVEVVENPVNPWCRPAFDSDRSLLFQPAAHGDDFGPLVRYQLLGPSQIGGRAPLVGHKAVEVAHFGVLEGKEADGEVRAQATAALDRARFLGGVTRWRGRVASMMDPARISRARAETRKLLSATGKVLRRTPAGAELRADPSVEILGSGVSLPATWGGAIRLEESQAAGSADGVCRFGLRLAVRNAGTAEIEGHRIVVEVNGAIAARREAPPLARGAEATHDVFLSLRPGPNRIALWAGPSEDGAQEAGEELSLDVDVAGSCGGSRRGE